MGISQELENLKEQLSIGFKETYKTLIAFKKSRNSPLVVSKNGKVVEIQPENLCPPPENAED